jgi:hypothetical protein
MEFPVFFETKYYDFADNLVFHKGASNLFATACAVTLPGLAGGEYSPLPASKGLAFPFLRVLGGYPTAPASFAQREMAP